MRGVGLRPDDAHAGSRGGGSRSARHSCLHRRGCGGFSAGGALGPARTDGSSGVSKRHEQAGALLPPGVSRRLPRLSLLPCPRPRHDRGSQLECRATRHADPRCQKARHVGSGRYDGGVNITTELSQEKLAHVVKAHHEPTKPNNPELSPAHNGMTEQGRRNRHLGAPR